MHEFQEHNHAVGEKAARFPIGLPSALPIQQRHLVVEQVQLGRVSF
jgi:hypothetical protein